MHFISSKPCQLCTTDTGWEKFKVQLLELGTKPCHCWLRWGTVTHRHHLGCLVWTAWAAHPSVWNKGCKVGFLAGNCLSGFGAQLYKPDMTKPSACPLGLSLWGGPSVLSQLFCPVLSWLSCAVLALLCCSGCPVLSCAMLCQHSCAVLAVLYCGVPGDVGTCCRDAGLTSGCCPNPCLVGHQIILI